MVTHLAGPEVRRAVEEAHRRHMGTITWESGWFGVCSCGWSSTKVSQDKAWEELGDHEASMIRPAAQGTPSPPPARPPATDGPLSRHPPYVETLGVRKPERITHSWVTARRNRSLHVLPRVRAA